MYFRRIKDMHIDNDMRQKDVEEILGCHEGVYNRYENGIRDMPLLALIKLGELYDVNIDYLLGVTDNKRKFLE